MFQYGELIVFLNIIADKIRNTFATLYVERSDPNVHICTTNICKLLVVKQEAGDDLSVCVLNPLP